MPNDQIMTDRSKNIKKLRQRIYMIESFNLRKKEPKKDAEMVEEVIRAIRQIVEEEGD